MQWEEENLTVFSAGKVCLLPAESLIRIYLNAHHQQAVLSLSVNQILLFLLVFTICVILYNKVHKMPSALLKNDSGMNLLLESIFISTLPRLTPSHS